MIKDARLALTANKKNKELTDKFGSFLISWNDYLSSEESTFPTDIIESDGLTEHFTLYGNELWLRFRLYQEKDGYKGAIEVRDIDSNLMYRNLFDSLGNIYLETPDVKGLDWSITDEKYCQFYLAQLAVNLLETMVRTEVNFGQE